MTTLVNMKGKMLPPDGCGGCKGSSSDNHIRPQAADLPPVTLPATTEADLVGTGDRAA